jgi:hypothetical protein
LSNLARVELFIQAVASRELHGDGGPRISDLRKGSSMLGTILLIILVLLLLGALPSWGHSRSWGYGPSGSMGLVLVVVLVLVLMGRI